jgi:hypothetical protein
VPDAAARLADIGAADADPLEATGLIEHFAQQLTVAGLQLSAVGQRRASFGDALGEPVANGLQLAQIEHPRCGRNSLDLMRDLRVAERLTKEAGQLRLESRDLAAQLEPRLALIDFNPKPSEIFSFKQNGHQGKL